MINYDKYIVPIYINRSLVGTGLLLNSHVVTVNHIFNGTGIYEVLYENEYYEITTCNYSSSINTDACIMKIVDNSLNINYKPDYFIAGKNNEPSTDYLINNNLFVKGYPLSVSKIYEYGNSVRVSFESGLNYLNAENGYNYFGQFFSIKSEQVVVCGYSGAPVFDCISGVLTGFVTRKVLPIETKEHVNVRGTVTYIVPIQAYLENETYKYIFGNEVKQIKKEELKIISTVQSVEETNIFIGRETFIDDLEHVFLGDSNQVVAVVNGMGGMGKSEVCKAFFKKIYNKETNIDVSHLAWIEYNNSLRESIFNGIDFKIIGLPLEMQNNDENFRIIESNLRQHNKRLFIFIDNMDDPTKDDLELLKRIGCKTIFSSRKNKIDNVTICKDISRLEPDECRDLYLIHYTNIQHKNDYLKDKYKNYYAPVKIIVELADKHTLMIKLLSTTQRYNENSFEEFIYMLKSTGFNLEEQCKIPHNDENKTLMEHCSKVFDLVKTNISEEAKVFLKQISIFPNIKWDKNSLKRYFKINNLDVVNELVDKSWLNKESSDFSGVSKYYIHTIISDTIKYKLKPNYIDYNEFIELLADDLIINEKETFRDKMYYFEMALEFTKTFLDKTDISYSRLIHNIAFVYSSQGDYQKALGWYEKALVIREKVLGIEHPSMATTYNNIAVVYDSQGEYQKAIEWYEKALVIREKVLGTDHPSTATTYNNIAVVYDSNGDYAKALEWYEKALVIREKVLGKEHPDTATTYNNIAGVYSARETTPRH